MNTGISPIHGVPTTVNVSSSFLKKCNSDPEKAAYLEENLKAIPDCVKSLCNQVGNAPGSPIVTYATYNIDENGNISCVSGSTNDPNGKIARKNAKRKADESKIAKEKISKKWAEKKAEELKKERLQEEKAFQEKMTEKAMERNTLSNNATVELGNSRKSLNIKI